MTHMSHFAVNVELEIFLELYQNQSFGRELARILNQPLKTVQRALTRLESETTIISKMIGKNRIYSLAKNTTARYKFLEAQVYKTQKILCKYPLLKPVCSDICKTTSAPVLIFGSYAKFNAKEQSDIDIHIQTNDIAQKKNIEKLNTNLSAKVGLLGNDPLSKEIKAHCVILQGYEVYYDAFEKILL